MNEFYFVVRTDVGPDSGQQRVFGIRDDEGDASVLALQIASSMYGDFAVVGPARIVVNIVREGGAQAVRAEPVAPPDNTEVA